ncbi:hypothetical protein EDB82DRAFT_334881 [Fusarium venenatum]|uniref:uncharacterized protein n=1 Tax=Fusarium venenatum TaxID=56646 RepID=UPI001E1610A9|nr:hypothetical protein EDB82DRAFT_334881 [Fusarium venenatum]
MAGRDLPGRSTDYRDRPTDRYRCPPRDTRDTDHDVRRNERRETDRFIPRNHVGQKTSSSSTPGGRSASRCDFQVGMELIGEMSAAHGDLMKADSRLNKIKKEFNKSGSRPIEFASIGPLQQKEIERGEEESDRLRRKLAQIYPRLQAELDSYLRTSANPVTRPGTPKGIRNESDLEPRLSELRQSILRSGESGLQNEVTALQEAINEEKQRKQALADELEAQKRKNQSLEDRVSTLEVMFKTIQPAVEVQISSEIHKQISPRITSLEDNLNKGLSNNAEATKQLQRLIDGHTEQLATLTSKRSADLVASPSSTTVAQTAIPNATAETIRLRDTLEVQVRNINFMQKEKLEPTLSKIRDLERAVEQSSQDSQQAKRLVKIQSSMAEDYKKKQRSLEEKFSTFENAARDQAKKHSDLDATFTRLYSEQVEENRARDITIASLKSSTESFRKKTESLETNVASLGASIKEKLQTEEGQASNLAQLQSAVNQQQKRTDDLGQKVNSDLAQLKSTVNQQQKRADDLGQKLASVSSASTVQASELSSLQSSIAKQHSRSSLLEKNVTSLKSEITKRSPEDFEKLNAIIQEYPPAADLKCIVADFPSSKDIKMLIADVLELRESVSKLKAGKTPTPPPPNPTSSTTNETITHVVEDKIMQLDIATKEEMYKLFEDLFKKLSHNNEECTKQSFADVNKKLEKSKEQTEMVKKAGESLRKRCNEQTASFEKEINQLLQEANAFRSSVNSELEDVEFRIQAMDSWKNNLSSKKWYDNLSQHVVNYAANQLANLSARISTLECIYDDPEGSNKRRRTGSSNPPRRGTALLRSDVV